MWPCGCELSAEALGLGFSERSANASRIRAVSVGVLVLGWSYLPGFRLCRIAVSNDLNLFIDYKRREPTPETQRPKVPNLTPRTAVEGN